MKIRNATAADSRLIAEGIVMAITPELVAESLGAGHTAAEGVALFESLARRTDSQYSYLNSLVAEDEHGEPMGVAVGYDGALLHSLREAFIAAARQQLGLELEGKIPDETDGGEFYIDTLAVLPSHRRRGVGGALLLAMAERGAAIGKPAGLLVDKANPRARALYEKSGFRQVGERYFFGEMMDHLQIPTNPTNQATDHARQQ